jgi:hypothetical protein
MEEGKREITIRYFISILSKEVQRESVVKIKL